CGILVVTTHKARHGPCCWGRSMPGGKQWSSRSNTAPV
ncbi:MAG: hypothetical protein AVDCRST_MAG88-956, partial [uncultured Thermomicrobiales bacterium]